MKAIGVKNIDLEYLSTHGEKIMEKSDIPLGHDIQIHIADYDDSYLEKLIKKYNKEELYNNFKNGKWDIFDENDAVKEIRLLLKIFKEYPEFDGIFNIEIDKNEKKFLVPSCTGNILGTINL